MRDRKPVLLYVEDSKLMRVLIDEELKRRYEVINAPDGLEALAVMAEREVDAVLLDINMPVLNGYHFLGIIKGTYSLLRDDDKKAIDSMENECVKRGLSGEFKDMPVVVFSTQSYGNEERLKLLGADSVLNKPYISLTTRGDIIEAIETAMDRRGMGG